MLVPWEVAVVPIMTAVAAGVLPRTVALADGDAMKRQMKTRNLKMMRMAIPHSTMATHLTLHADMTDEESISGLHGASSSCCRKMLIAPSVAKSASGKHRPSFSQRQLIIDRLPLRSFLSMTLRAASIRSLARPESTLTVWEGTERPLLSPPGRVKEMMA